MGGADNFVFNTDFAISNVDTITDFSVEQRDDIRLDDKVFRGLLADQAGDLSNAQFALGSAAQDASDRIIYNPTRGDLFYDADGAGGQAAILFARLDAGLALTANNFEVI